MYAAIRGIEYHLPTQTLSNSDLARQFPEWPPEKILAKTGIECRRIAAAQECASDLAVAAAQKLLERHLCPEEEIDFLLLCTQSPDYLLPTTACLVQDRLKLPTRIAALDINLGCSGYVYGLALAKCLVEAGKARNVLLVTCDTYSKHMDPGDFGVRALFGDGAAATLVQAVAEPPASSGSWIGPFVYGSDGTGEANFILPRGGTRQPCPDSSRPESSAASARDPLALRMDGPAIFTFTLSAVPASVSRLLEQAHLTLGDVDQFVFHQANQFMLEHLRRKLNIAPERFVYAMRDCGNTTSSSVPIALRRAADAGSLASGARVMLVGFGVGYSWGATLIRWYAV